MGTKSSELKDGCFAHAADDEPIFVLRANDEQAWESVFMWAGNYAHKHIEDGTLDSNRLIKLIDAIDTANRMRQWKR